ncbi:MAG: cation:proton antiporter [Candidatus Nanopelagicales bacterium]|jgi:Kef-type K+ transport system membrane component KefB|nr:cation:proton antiporter [Candidatus Nanopelagicales bacterium]MDP4907646.1 cation:proton antiporter [Candidatus Nanopelagicales bacterium]MDP4974737.1 cation:proton antiporter [Candidatus Nanopelagicales bacterium]MDP5095851.1 cation:proton antiporter [Candidatus Nanopelagicales bacterium]
MDYVAVMAAAADSDLEREIYSLLVIAAIAAATPLIVGLLRLPVAEVVLMLGLGIIFGPEVLGWIQLDEAIDLLAELGLAFLFFAAGLELEKHAIQGRSGKLALLGWGVSAVIALLVAGLLEAAGVIDDFLGVAICLTSTALGTLLPILRDKGLLKSPFGTYFMGAGAIGEFGPVLAISLLLTTKSFGMAVLSLVLFGAFALLFAKIPTLLRTDHILSVIERGQETSAQTVVRLTALLLVALLALAEGFDLDVVLGAFIAGIIIRQLIPAHQEGVLQTKVEGIAFGVFIPIFFIVSGARLDIESILANPSPLLIFFILLLVVRGVPQFFLYRRAIPDTKERAGFSLYVATALPIIVAVTTVQLSAGVMSSATAAALVGAGALSVLVFPLLAQVLVRKRSEPQEERNAATA